MGQHHVRREALALEVGQHIAHHLAVQHLGLEVGHVLVQAALRAAVDMVLHVADTAHAPRRGLGDRDQPMTALARQSGRDVTILGGEILVNEQHLHGRIMANRRAMSTARGRDVDAAARRGYKSALLGIMTQASESRQRWRSTSPP